jgi:hypothetical protein
MSTLKTSLVATLVALAGLTAATGAHAAVHPNGSGLNGLSANGWGTNGWGQNGVFNGLSANALTNNALTKNALVSNGPDPIGAPASTAKQEEAPTPRVEAVRLPDGRVVTLD